MLILVPRPKSFVKDSFRKLSGKSETCKSNSREHRNQSEHDVVRLDMKDDGVGFDADSLSDAGSFGLIGIRERIQKLKGEFTIVSRKNEGTKLIVVLPLSVPTE